MPRRVARLYSAMRTMARMLGARRPGRHSRRNASPHIHCRQSSCGRNSSGALSWNIHLSSLRGACGLAQGSAYDTEIWAPLAKLVSCAGPVQRSMTTTSWPAWFSHQALEIPMMPPPNTATFMPALLLACQLGSRTRCPRPMASCCHGSLPRRFARAYGIKRGGSHKPFQARSFHPFRSRPVTQDAAFARSASDVKASA
ncbi:hypothetical protein D9M68_565860 [compost metagenome]